MTSEVTVVTSKRSVPVVPDSRVTYVNEPATNVYIVEPTILEDED